MLLAGTLVAVAAMVVAVATRGTATAPRAPAAARVQAAIPASSAAISRLLGADERQFWVRRTAAGLIARNAGQRFTVGYGSQGVEIRLPGGSVAMRLADIAPMVPSIRANRVTYAHGNGLSEWYANGPLGLEQGLKLSTPGASTLTFHYALGGTLTPRLTGGVIDFTAPGAGSPALSYRGLSASDASGRTLPSRLSLAGNLLTITVNAAGARYPINVDPTIQGANLTGSDSTSNDRFGSSVAQNDAGNVVVVGAPNAKVGTVYTGAAYAFVEPKSGWANATQTVKLTPPDGANSDRFGQAVGVVGTTIVVGAPGHAVGGTANAGAVYAWASGSTTPVKLVASPATANAGLGSTIAVSGPQLFAGAPGYNSSHGAVFEYTQSSSAWANNTTQDAILTASDTSYELGSSVAATGTTVVSGAPFNTSGSNADAGAAYVFDEPSTGWGNMTQTAELTASDPSISARFGTSVAIYVNTGTIAVGAQGAGGGKGATYVFQEPSGGWKTGTQTAEMTQSTATTFTGIGHTVAITDPAGTGPPLAPGAKAADSGPPTPSGWQIAVVGGSSNGTGLTSWSASNGTWANQSSGTPVNLPVLGTAASAYSVNVGPGLLAIGNQTTIGNVVVVPTATSTTTATCVGTNCCTSASTVCCAAGDSGSSPVDVHPDLNGINCENRGFYYFFSTGYNTVKGAVGYVLVPVGVAAAGFGYFSEVPSAGASTALVLGGILTSGAGAWMIRTSDGDQHDPPDPHFQSLASVAKVAAVKIRAGKGLSAKAAKALATYLTELSKARALATTLYTTVNRAGSAVTAGNTQWTGKQVRYAIGLVGTFNATVSVALKDAKALSKAGKHSAALNVKLTAAKLRAAMQRIRKHGVPRGLAKQLAKGGLTVADVKAYAAQKLPGKLPKTLLQYLTGPSTTSALKAVAALFNDWANTGQVKAEAGLT